MKRRGFLSLLGAAVAAPLIPAQAGGLTARAGALAAAHAQRFPFVSAIGLSRGLDVPLAQAQSLLLELSRKGVVGPVSQCAYGPTHAASKVFTPAVKAVVRTAAARHAAKAKTPAVEQNTSSRPSADQPHTWLAHLQDICQRNGFVLQPRALDMVA